MEGKEIGQATGFKLAELEKLESGSTLKVGGREVLVSSLGSSQNIYSTVFSNRFKNK